MIRAPGPPGPRVGLGLGIACLDKNWPERPLKRTREDKAKTPTESPARDTGKRPTDTRAAAPVADSRDFLAGEKAYRMAVENWQVTLHRGKHWQLEYCETWSNINPTYPRVSRRAKTGTLGPHGPKIAAAGTPDPGPRASSSLGIVPPGHWQRSALS